MLLTDQWRDVARLLTEAGDLLSSAQTARDLAIVEDTFFNAEVLANELLEKFPEAMGKQPYEGDFRTTVAGRLLGGVLRRVQELRDGTIPKNVAKKEIQEMAIELINLRADHGRFFDTKLNTGINKVENLYQKLLRQKSSVSPD